MIQFVKKFLAYCKEQEKREIAVKRYVINQQLVRFYEDLQQTKGECNNVPACVLAYQAMKEKVKTDKDVKVFYKKLLAAGLV
jgi:hypothetical protein